LVLTSRTSSLAGLLVAAAVVYVARDVLIPLALAICGEGVAARLDQQVEFIAAHSPFSHAISRSDEVLRETGLRRERAEFLGVVLRERAAVRNALGDIPGIDRTPSLGARPCS
jgi:hypothetical protein